MRTEVESVGVDRVVRRGDQVVVYSAVDMPDWEVRRFRARAIHFRGARYRIARRSSLPAGGVRYVLEPWPDDGGVNPPGAEIVYDDAYVQSRDLERRAVARASVMNRAFLPLVPFVGFLPAACKARLHERFGIHPATATQVSVWMEFFAVAVAGAFLSMNAMSTGGLERISGGRLRASWLAGLAIVAGVDGLVRYGELMKEIDPPGFLEWLFRLRLR